MDTVGIPAHSYEVTAVQSTPVNSNNQGTKKVVRISECPNY